MIDRKMLNQISRGIQAAEHVRNVYDTSIRSSSNAVVVQDRVSLLAETLSAVAEYYPGPAGSRLTEALERSNKYCRNYRDVKNHFRSVKSGDADSRDIIKTLKVLSPVLGNRSSTLIDKVLLLIEALNY